MASSLGPNSQPHAGEERLLLVHDELMVGESRKEMLTHFGYQGKSIVTLYNQSKITTG